MRLGLLSAIQAETFLEQQVVTQTPQDLDPRNYQSCKGKGSRPLYGDIQGYRSMAIYMDVCVYTWIEA